MPTTHIRSRVQPPAFGRACTESNPCQSDFHRSDWFLSVNSGRSGTGSMLLLSVPLSEHAELEVPDWFPVGDSGNESTDEIPIGRPGSFFPSSSKVRLFRINR